MNCAEAIAIVSDIHGNGWALRAVLEDIERRGLGRMVNLGDCLYGPLDPEGTAEILIPFGLPTVRGNEDRIILEPSPMGGASPTLGFVRSRLDERTRLWLAGLPLTVSVEPGLFLFHGQPRRDDAYLLREATPAGLRDRNPDELEGLLAGVKQGLILCGHDHTPGEARLADGRLVVNPGSVGLQAYTDDVPHGHAIAAGTPHARYSIIRPDRDGWRVENIRVAYDWEIAAATAEANGRPDWAFWLRTGRVS